ncbi:MAG: hypothetical protein H7287_12095 [Thermoleophilia bacterium]|nr:hypothetical protein [Thermoleophilia bacterium]
MNPDQIAPEPEAQQASAYVPPVVDESKGFDIGPLDIILGVLTLPLLLFAIQYAVSGSESVIATPKARLKLFAVLLSVEVVAVAIILFIVLR